MGIGGLDNEFSQIFRRAFASRLFPPSVIAKLGIRHTRGILLYGPPGTGKTLMARQIGQIFTGKEPKIVIGSHVGNKYIGEAEENICAIFAEAEAEYAAKGDESSLHIIIFDEIDAICKSRGSTSGVTDVGNSVVNQLISKLHSVKSLNNILVIALTNRIDLIDEALIRSCCLDVQVEIPLPNTEGRLQIFLIHTKKLSANGLLAPDVDRVEFAKMTEHYTGAEIQRIIYSATSFAMTRQVDMAEENLIIITRADLLRSTQEVMNERIK